MFDPVDGVWRYRSSPIEVEAIQYLDPDVIEVLARWGCTVQIGWNESGKEGAFALWNGTSQEWNTVQINDFVVKDSKGNFYPCDPEVFYNKYIRLGQVYEGEVPPEEEINVNE